MKDIIDDLDSCQNTISDCIDDYEELVKEHLEMQESLPSTCTPVPSIPIPCTSITIDALQYPEDRFVWYRGHPLALKAALDTIPLSRTNKVGSAAAREKQRQEIEGKV